MPVYRLNREIAFPSPHEAEPDGLLAVGGDLGGARLLLAYSMGIFPCTAKVSRSCGGRRTPGASSTSTIFTSPGGSGAS